MMENNNMMDNKYLLQQFYSDSSMIIPYFFLWFREFIIPIAPFTNPSVISKFLIIITLQFNLT